MPHTATGKASKMELRERLKDHRLPGAWRTGIGWPPTSVTLRPNRIPAGRDAAGGHA